MNRSFQPIVETPIAGGKTISELLSYQGIGYWWFIDTALYRYLKRAETTPLHNILAKIPNLLPAFLFVGDIIDFIEWNIIEIISQQKLKDSNSRNKPLILYRLQLEEWTEFLLHKKPILRNKYHSDIIDSLPNTIQILAPYEIPYPVFLHSDKIKIYRNILNKQGNSSLNSTVMVKYWSIDVWRQAKNAASHFNTIWKQIERNDEWFVKWGELTNVDPNQIKRFLEIQIRCMIPYWVRYNTICENMIRKERPNVMIMTNEQMSNGRGWIYTAKKFSIPTIGIQHGVIANHPAYFNHSIQDISSIADNGQISYPIPDVTIVWGKKEYDLLMCEAFYPNNRLALTGNPRYDSLIHISSKYSRDAVCSRYNIDPSNKLILWATQSHGWGMEENYAYFDEIFLSLQDLENVTLIIKQHPVEGDKYTQLICDYIKKSKISVIHPDKTADTTEMVYVSDLIILKNSTTGQEAVVFHKPMIVMDFSTNPDAAEYVKEGVAAAVYNKGELKEKIITLLYDGADISSTQDSYIENHMYKIDGKASLRCANIIYKYVQNTIDKKIS